jgi:hypothetical protein
LVETNGELLTPRRDLPADWLPHVPGRETAHLRRRERRGVAGTAGTAKGWASRGPRRESLHPPAAGALWCGGRGGEGGRSCRISSRPAARRVMGAAMATEVAVISF